MRLRIFLAALLLAACTPTDAPVPDTVEDEIIDDRTEIEQLPAELSVDYFSKMRLVGTGLTLTTITRTDAYTQYAADYWSNGLRISGILNIPFGDGPFPLILTNHGHISPSIYTRGRGLRREQDALARAGFAVFHSDYRGHGESDESPDTKEIYDAGLEYSMDVVNAIHAVENADLPEIDTTSVGMLGHSMGGGISLNIAVAYPELVDAVALYAPVSSDAWDNFMRWRDEREEGDRTREALGTREENPAAWDALSSQTHLANIDDPILLFHGTSDADVPIAWSEELTERLTDLGKLVTYVVYEGEGHEYGREWPDFMQRQIAFFNQYLQAAPPVAPTAGSSVVDPARITKKPFGIFITPETSPVSPERFRGYHTGADFEATVGEEDTLLVPAICRGELVYSNWVNGYGGVAVQKCTIDTEVVTVLYGHIDHASVTLPIGTIFEEGAIIGHLGEGFSEETNGERPHLHLSVHTGDSIELRGYAENEEELSAWRDPLTVINR
jgi:pimeloyl-ACP methyl ester carboxylesterase